MQKQINEDGSYNLIATEGKDLVVIGNNNEVIDRTKEVYIPPAGTLNTWEEVDALPPEPEVVIDPKQQELAELEARIAQLKAEVTTV